MFRLTPSFHPIIGMKPRTVVVMRAMLTVAMIPTQTFIVATMRMGSAHPRPTKIPVRADDTSSYKRSKHYRNKVIKQWSSYHSKRNEMGREEMGLGNT